MEPPLIDVSAVLDQHLGGLQLVLQGRVVQGGHPAAQAAGVTANVLTCKIFTKNQKFCFLPINFSSGIDEQFHDFGSAHCGRQVEGGPGFFKVFLAQLFLDL